MPVTASITGIIFCEGKGADSYDYYLLNRLLVSSGPRVVPIGGKFGFNAYIDGYLSSYSQKPPFLAFRDRDFDYKPPETPTLLPVPGSKPIWATYRACIESYLIDADLLRSYWIDMSAGPKWNYGPVPDLAVIQEKLTDSAQQIAAYQAVRWALADLKPGRRWPELGTTWQQHSGELPSSFAYSDCLDNAHQLMETYLSESSAVSIEKFDKLAEQYWKFFAAPEFYTNQGQLVWFHGKDLLQAVCQSLGIQPLRGNYVFWAIGHFIPDIHPDLLTLKQLCAKL